MKTRTPPEEGFSALTDDAERNRLLAEMAEQSTDMISRHTPPDDWRFIYASPAVTHLLGYSVEEIVGMSAYDLYHPDDVEDFRLRAPTVTYDRGGLYTIPTDSVARTGTTYGWKAPAGQSGIPTPTTSGRFWLFPGMPHTESRLTRRTEG